MRARVRHQSQPDVLRKNLESADIRHGETAIVDIDNVVLASTETETRRKNPEGKIFFCESVLRVHHKTGTADGKQIPEKASVHRGLKFPRPGTYDIKRAKLVLNGQMHIRATAETEIIEREPIYPMFAEETQGV